MYMYTEAGTWGASDDSGYRASGSLCEGALFSQAFMSCNYSSRSREPSIEFHNGRVHMKPERKARGLNLGCCKAFRVRQAACGSQVETSLSKGPTCLEMRYNVYARSRSSMSS